MEKQIDRRSRIYLTVPYDEKDQAKALGAKWDGVVKKWYVHEALTYNPSADIVKLLKTWSDGYDVPDPQHVVVEKEIQDIRHKINHVLQTSNNQGNDGLDLIL